MYVFHYGICIHHKGGNLRLLLLGDGTKTGLSYPLSEDTRSSVGILGGGRESGTAVLIVRIVFESVLSKVMAPLLGKKCKGMASVRAFFAPFAATFETVQMRMMTRVMHVTQVTTISRAMTKSECTGCFWDWFCNKRSCKKKRHIWNFPSFWCGLTMSDYVNTWMNGMQCFPHLSNFGLVGGRQIVWHDTQCPE